MACFIIPPLVLSLCTGLYLVKKDSAAGRLLIWKVAFRTVKEQPLTGHGFNTAQSTLAPTQARYFAAGNGTENEKMLAGSVRWVFNEFLQTASETGLVGLFLFLLVIGYALFYKTPTGMAREHYLLTGAARATLTGILMFGCFSYPFYSLPITVLFFFALTTLSVIRLKTRTNSLKSNKGVLRHIEILLSQSLYKKIRPWLFKIPVLVFCLATGLFYLLQTSTVKQGYWLWDEALMLYQMQHYENANESFSEAVKLLPNNGLLLQQHGKSLYMAGEYNKAIEILKTGGIFYKDEFWYIIMGDCHKETRNYNKAENYYQKAACMVPHKLYPGYLLAKLYSDTGQTRKAEEMALKVLSKTPKVASPAVQEIKDEMQKILELQMSNF
jgi:tetratricopeptide (TPR) repeat protein